MKKITNINFLNNILKNKQNKFLLIILFSAFIVRLLFILFGAKYLYGDNIYTTNDTPSYVNSFLNLLNHGYYTHDFRVEDAAFGRLPGYPFFWGIHYLIFGKATYLAVAITQAILDSLIVIFVFKIVEKLTKNQHAPYIGALIIAFNPFTIMWVSISTTEIFATFLSTLVLYVFLCKNWFYKKPVWLGLLIVLTLFTRVYLGILLPVILIAAFFIESNKKLFLRKAFLVLFSFLIAYSIWPIRNYLSYNKIELLKPKTAGYITLSDDVHSFRSWVYCWNVSDWDPWFEEIIHTNQQVNFPDEIFSNQQERLYADTLVELCRTCGGGFHAWTNSDILEKNCNDEIVKGFTKLKTSYTRNNFLNVYFIIPLKNLWKSFFDINFQSQKDSSFIKTMILTILALFRGLIISLGLFYALIKIRNSGFLLIALFSTFMLFFLTTIIRNIEIRYYIQVDIFLIISFSVFAGIIISKLKLFFNKKNKT